MAISVKWACVLLLTAAIFGVFVLVLSAVSSMSLDEFKMCLLWLLMICLVLFIQL